MMDSLLSLVFVGQVLRITVPYALAALGGTLSERSGIINLALEGMLLSGAFCATLGAHAGGPLLGIAAGVVGGLLIAGLYALAVVVFRADQVVAGVAVNLLSIGLTRYLLQLVFHSASSSPTVPGFGTGYGATTFVALACVMVLAVQVIITRTAFGLRLRACGENPEAASSLGVSVLRTRLVAVLASGALAGLGGGWLALDNRGFVDQMSGGRGYIALAAMIFGRWHPVGAAAACLLFGFVDALQINLQTQVTFLPTELLQMLPYLVTMVALAGFVGKSRSPAALGRPPVDR